MRNDDIAVIVKRHAIGTGARELYKMAGPQRWVIQFDTPNGTCTGNCNIQCILPLR